MCFVIHDLELLLNYFRYARTGPHLTTKAVGFRTMRQEIRNESLLGLGKSGCGTGMRTGTQSITSLFLHGRHPLAHCTWGDAQGFGNVFLLPTFVFEVKRSPTSDFFPVLRAEMNDCHALLVACTQKFSKLCNGQ